MCDEFVSDKIEIHIPKCKTMIHFYFIIYVIYLYFSISLSYRLYVIVLRILICLNVINFKLVIVISCNIM